MINNAPITEDSHITHVRKRKILRSHGDIAKMNPRRHCLNLSSLGIH